MFENHNSYLHQILFNHSALSPVSPLYYSVASNAWHRAKPIPLCRAVPWFRRCLKQNFLSRREQAPALRYDSIITQVGRGNNPSAEICILRVAEDVDPYKHCVKHPYEKEPKGFLFAICRQTVWENGVIHPEKACFCVGKGRKATPYPARRPKGSRPRPP